MLSVNDIFSVEISDVTILGAGLAKIDGIAVFVRGGVTGDVCSIRITEVKKSYANAELLQLTLPSPLRISNDCPHFPLCGGCVHRCISYESEGGIKERAVLHALAKAGVEPRIIRQVILPPESGYRNKVTFHFDPRGSVGFYSPESRTVVPLDGIPCRVTPPLLCRIAEDVSRAVKDEGLTPPSEMMLRITSEGEVLASLTGALTDEELGRLTVAICRSPEVTGVVSRRTAKDRYRVLMGERCVTTNLAGLRFRISPEAFFQVNYEGAELLFGEVTRLAGTRPFKKCADLYCGTGTIGLILASRYPEARITGVEINAEAVADAKYNARVNGIGNADFFCGDAAGYARDESPELVVVDPPRKGLSQQMLDVLKQTGAQTVIYVSCNPFTLARDLKWLTENGYAVDEVTAVNMFPRSEHCEVVCALRKTT